jgi:hypothetical protein
MTTSHAVLLRNLGIAVKRDHMKRRRRRRVITMAAAFVLLTGATIAAATGLPWWQSAAPAVNPRVVHQQLAPGSLQWPASADSAKARTVAEWRGATLVAAPVSGGRGGYCLIPALPGSPDIGYSCEYQATDEVRAYARPGADARWIVWGRFVAPTATAIDLTKAIGTALRVRLQPGGFFIVELPRARWAALNDGAGSAILLDASGKSIGEKCLDFGPSPQSVRAGSADTPSSLTAGKCAPPPTITGQADVSKARQLVQSSLQPAQGKTLTIALYQAPDTGGTATCFLIAPVPLPSNPRTLTPMQCGIAAPTSRSNPVSAVIDQTFINGHLHYVIAGWVDTSIDAARVELHSLAGTLKIHFDNHAFLEAIPGDNGAYLAKPVILIYDKSGREIAREPVR